MNLIELILLLNLATLSDQSSDYCKRVKHIFSHYLVCFLSNDSSLNSAELRGQIKSLGSYEVILIERNKNALFLSNRLFSESIDYLFAYNIGEVILHGFGGIDINFDARSLNNLLSHNFEPMSIKFDYSRLQMVDSLGIMVNTCDLNELEAVLNGGHRAKFLNSLRFLEQTKYQQMMCPYLFINAQIGELFISHMVDSLVKLNVLTFGQLKRNGSLVQLNSSVEYLNFRHIYMTLLSDLTFSPQVFESEIRCLMIEGILGQVQPQFLHKLNVHYIGVELRNFRQFFALNLEWLQVGKEVNEAHQRQMFFIQAKSDFDAYLVEGLGTPLQVYEKQFYYFPDEDFCLFAKYPTSTWYHIIQDLDMNASCTVIWLMQAYLNPSYTDEAQQFIRLRSDSPYAIIDFTHLSGQLEGKFESLWAQCNMSRRVEMCSSPKIELKVEWTIYDTVFTVAYSKFILVVLGQPVLLTVGLLLSTASIFTIRRALQKLESHSSKPDDKLHRQKVLFIYLMAYFVFSLVYCAFKLPSLLAECVKLDGIYCSPLLTNRSMRLFNLFACIYAANVGKLGANLTQCAFSQSRLLMNLNSKSRILKLFARSTPTVVITFIIIISFTFNLVRLFYNEQYSIEQINQHPGYNLFYYIRSNRLLSRTEPTALIIYTLLVLVDDLGLLIVNLIIDLVLIRFIRRSFSSSKITSLQNDRLKMEKKTTKMILLAGLLGALVKLPHAMASLYRSLETINDLGADIYLGSACIFMNAIFDSLCLNLNALTEALLPLGTIINFLSLYKLNGKFRKEFKNFFTPECTKTGSTPSTTRNRND
nr:G protein-coupled receptor [Proales similis]